MLRLKTKVIENVSVELLPVQVELTIVIGSSQLCQMCQAFSFIDLLCGAYDGLMFPVFALLCFVPQDCRATARTGLIVTEYMHVRLAYFFLNLVLKSSPLTVANTLKVKKKKILVDLNKV